MPVFCQKTSIFSKTPSFHARILSKNVHSQKHIVLMSFFFNIFMKNLCCNANIWSKNVNSVKITLLYGPKKSKWCPIFPIFDEKLNALMPIFSEKTSILYKKKCSHPIFCQKNVSSLKNTLLPCYFFQIIHENPILSCPNLVKRTSIVSKLHYLMGQEN